MKSRRTLRNRPLQERFDACYQAMPSGCWIWQSTLKNGYGIITIDKRAVYAHRLSWRLVNGIPPADMEVCHSCDVPRCVNPAHLFLGTHADNMGDALAKGRIKNPPTKRGTAHGMVKLSDEQVIAIRKSAADGHTHEAIGYAFGVTAANVSMISRRKTWRHI